MLGTNRSGFNSQNTEKTGKIRPELLVLIDHEFGSIGGQPAKKERI